MWLGMHRGTVLEVRAVWAIALDSQNKLLWSSVPLGFVLRQDPELVITPFNSLKTMLLACVLHAAQSFQL